MLWSVASQDRRWSFGVAGAVLLAFFLNLGGYPLFDLDEGAFSQATLEMIASGNYLSTTLDGAPRYDKPIFSYWMQALSVHLFGAQDFAFRLPSAIAASLWVFAVFLFVRARAGAPAAGAAALLIAFSVGPMVIGRSATADAWLNLWLALTFIEIARWQEEQRRATLLRAYLWMGLGFLTKGPVAIAIPLLASLLFFLSAGRGRDWLKAAFNPLGWLVLAAVTLPWYVLVFLREGSGFFYGFFIEHNLMRFTETREGHGGTPLYYLVALPLVLSPFIGWMISALRRLAWRPSGLERLSWIWFGVVFLLVSASSTQLPHYVLYGITPLIVILALHRERFTNVWLAFIPPLIVLALLVAMPELLKIALMQVDRAYEVELGERGLEIFDFGYQLLMAAFLLAAIAVIVLFRAYPVWQRLLAIGALQTAAIVLVFIPAAADMQQLPVKQAAELARSLDRPVVAYRINMPTFSVYLGSPTERRMPEPGELAVTRSHAVAAVAEFHPEHPPIILYHSGGIVLLDVPARSVP